MIKKYDHINNRVILNMELKEFEMILERVRLRADDVKMPNEDYKLLNLISFSLTTLSRIIRDDHRTL